MKTYDDIERQELLRKAYKLGDEVGSLNKAGQLMKVSSAILSGLKSGAYKGNHDKQYAIIEAYFEADEAAKDVYHHGEYVPTSISEDIYEIIRNCHAKGGLAVAAGDAGVGKTQAAKKYAADNPNMAIYLSMNPCIKNIKAVLKALALRLNVTERTVDELWLGIAQKLRNNTVLIFDEAQHLPIKTIEMLRAFADYFADNGQTLGIVFIGNLETVSNFSGGKRAEFAQIANRTKQKRLYTVKNIKRSDITKLFPELAEQEKEIEFLYAIAQSRQALRGAVNLFANAYDNENISYNGLVAMAKHMEMDI